MPHTKSELTPIGETRRGNDVLANVVFVHGLGGDNQTTWQSDRKDKSAFWPQWLYQDLNGGGHDTQVPVGPVAVWSLGYPADVFRVLFFSKAPDDDSVPQRARDLLDTLVGHDLAERPIVFVAHSLGGVLVKQMLRSSSDASHHRGGHHKLVLSTRLVMFLATPHTGSSMARLAENVLDVKRLVVSGLVSTVEWLPISWGAKAIARWAVQRGPFTKALERGDPYLEDLAAWYRHNAPQIGIETKAYYENTRRKGVAIVVDKESANPGVSGVEAIPLDADHSSICKPDTRNEHYQRLCSPVRDAIKACPIFRETHLAVLDVGERFERLAQLHLADRLRATKKVVQPIEIRLGRSEPVDYESSRSGKGDFVVEDWQVCAAAASLYDLDRIILNVWHQYKGGIPASDPSVSVRHEEQKLRATGLENRQELTLIPLYYAARALRFQTEARGVQLVRNAVTDVQKALCLVETLATKFGMDDDLSTRHELRELLASDRS
jgi:pimeloyl-ACP methyl ester carboxylesterase